MKYYCCHWVSDTLHKRKGQIHVSVFSLLGMTIVMVCVLVLLASHRDEKLQWAELLHGKRCCGERCANRPKFKRKAVREETCGLVYDRGRQHGRQKGRVHSLDIPRGRGTSRATEHLGHVAYLIVVDRHPTAATRRCPPMCAGCRSEVRRTPGGTGFVPSAPRAQHMPIQLRVEAARSCRGVLPRWRRT